jgi:hypothetical protein
MNERRPHIRPWRGANADTHDSDSYGAHTRAHAVLMADPGSGGADAGTLGAFVRAQLQLGEGQEAFQAWVQRTAKRLGYA